ncbi:MAG TPA: PIN domain nuclease [Nocardioidaceae bacterium]|nr:PIN domain nuclease [Nocardioidaceae bacterium]
MTVVDSSVWIDYFNGVSSPQADILYDLLGAEQIVVGDLILAEVLQGFRREADFKAAHAALAAFETATMLGPELAVQSAANYRLLRRRGVTVRRTIDVMIATWCVERGHPLLFSDRDFTPCVRHLGLQSFAVG